MTPTRTETSLAIGLAARTLPPLWPLDAAIAINPLASLETLPFERAVRAGAEMFGARPSMALTHWRALIEQGRVPHDLVRSTAIEHLGGPDVALVASADGQTPLDKVMSRLLNASELRPVALPTDPAAVLVAKYCGAFFGSAAANFPLREQGLYHATRALLPFDPAFRALGGDATFSDTVSDATDCVTAELARRNIAAADAAPFLGRTLARLPGWGGHIRWRLEHTDAHRIASAPATIADLLALLLTCDRATGCEGPERAPAPRDHPVEERPTARSGLDDTDLAFICQLAAERHHERLVAPALAAGAVRAAAPDVPDRALAQIVMCIDVRSEPLRRAIEAQGTYETVGYAGFFGLMIAVHVPDRARVRQLPVLVQPQHDLALVPAVGCEKAAISHLRSERRTRGGREVFDALKGGVGSAFATAEATGVLGAAMMLVRTFLPDLSRRVGATKVGDESWSPSLDRQPTAPGLSPDERVGYARALFALTGMPHATSRLVVLAGHRGRAVNNPYASAYDCGACAGHGGMHNARAMAAIMNDSAVRQALAAGGIAVPADSVFIAGEHDTTTDEVQLFDIAQVPATHRDELSALEAALSRAGALNRSRRAEQLARSAPDLARGAAHWGEVRPEWGLAVNAAFIVGPRSISRDIDLEGRAFLHSYDWRIDTTGEALATILSAPMVVAQWINCQYLFSTIDNERYGSGDKTVHNPIGRIGVLSGNGGDLRVGLPYQALFDDDGVPRHIPQRLTTYVHAPRERVDAVVAGQEGLKRLFGNGWVRLVVIDPDNPQPVLWPGTPQDAQHRSTSEETV